MRAKLIAFINKALYRYSVSDNLIEKELITQVLPPLLTLKVWFDLMAAEPGLHTAMLNEMFFARLNVDAMVHYHKMMRVKAFVASRVMGP